MYISHSGVCASSMAFLYIYGLCKTEKFVHINRYGSYTETLATILRNSTLKKQKMNDKKIKNIKSQKNAALLLIFGPLILLISYIGKTDFDKYGINNYVICLSLFVLIICGGIGLKNSLRKQKELNR